jgi:ABC-type Fe3+ transport system substrate-binding protein
LAASAWAQGKTWETEWNEILAAARKEGKVVLKGPPMPDIRRDLPAIFKARFGISVDYIGSRTTDTVTQMRNERSAGLYTIDVLLAGIDTTANVLYPEKMLAPLKPALILPEFFDASKWKKGKPWFLDPEEQYVLRLFSYVSSLLQINTNQVKPADLKSIRDLLNPKWRGKIAFYDPTAGGTGLGTAAYFYNTFGEEFVKALYVDQKPGISRDRRQIEDWVARGHYPISPDVGEDRATRLRREGFPILDIYELSDAAGRLSMATGALLLVNKAPHPNAARVLVNWLASKEGLELYSKAHITATTRTDIDESSFPQQSIPRTNMKYFDSADWDYVVTGKEKARQRLREILGR